MKIRIVADSSANLFCLPGADFAAVPMRILAGDQEYVDDSDLDVPEMLRELGTYKGKSGTACPGIGDWLESFADADMVVGAALTSKLSGCYSAGMMAAQEYMEQHPGRRVFLLDTLSTGPEMELLLERYRDKAAEGLDFDAICEDIQDYLKRTHLMFALESLQNFVNNGRVSPAVAAVVKVLGISIVGKASDTGELQPLHKVRGGKRAVRQIFESMQKEGYRGGKVRIRHVYNPEAAEAMAQLIREHYPDSDVQVGINKGLCCYYAEKGGLLVGFESE